MITLRSGNTFGATFWTDGKVDAPMMPLPPPIVRCKRCGKVFWTAEAQTGYAFRWKAPVAVVCVAGAYLSYLVTHSWWLAIPIGAVVGLVLTPVVVSVWDGYVKAPTMVVLFQALDDRCFKDSQQELELRILAWQADNDRYRNANNDQDQGRSSQADHNLELLLTLLDETDSTQIVLKGEVLRELGRFDDAIEVLQRVGDDERRSADFVAQLARQGQWAVQAFRSPFTE